MTSAAGNTEDNVDDTPHDCSEAVVIIFQDNYGSTCELHVEISHIYTTEGDFNVSVMAFAARSVETIVVKNWTVTSVRSAVEDVSLSVDSVIAVHRNVTVRASVSPPDLRFLKYYWTLSRFDFMKDEVKSLIILSSVTDVPELRLILTDAGDYLINVTVENEIGASNDDVIITAVVPISAPLLSCSDGKHVSVNATFDCTATVEEGSAVQFLWDIGDGTSTQITTGNSSSTAAVTYPAVGLYNITVTAWNRLGSESVWKTVNIVENVFRLSVLAVEQVLVGNPVSVTACCMLGSNLTLRFDFGSGSHQLVLDPESRAITASHVYRLAGVYTVTVTAENNVSMAAARVTVNVLENVVDVDLKPISALVAGRHSVFMATFNGNFISVFV